MSFRSLGGDGGGPVKLSQITGSPTFRASAINAVAVIPLLSSDRNGEDSTTHSSESFDSFLSSLHRHNDINRNRNYGDDVNNLASDLNNTRNEPIVVVIPNFNLTRPGDWKYNETPLQNFHWGHGCQRLRFFDGRPYHSRLAHDRLINHELTRNWIDLCPSRRTGALIGILNVRDCPDQSTLERAIQEWHQWAERYSTPPYEVTAHGRDVDRDIVVPRLFVFDSFHESFVTNPNVDLQNATEKLKSNCLVAFPPVDEKRSQIMELHVNVVVNDLAVAIFQELEEKIRESDALMAASGLVKQGGRTATDSGPQQTVARTGFFGRSSASSSDGPNCNTEEDTPRGSGELSIEKLVAVVGPNSKLATARHSGSKNNNNNDLTRSASIVIKLENASSNNNKKSLAKTASRRTLSAVKAQLLTPLDEFWDYSELSPKDSHEMMKREVARREKFAADFSLLAGSPLDAYERYTKAADLCKTTSPDPLWYASALEGCAAAHIAMADIGGFNVDEYLESSFQLPEEIMACALVTASGKEKTISKGSNHNSKDNHKQNMPHVVGALCADALDVTSRHPKLACFHSELLLKLAWYTAEVEDVHLRCQWGLGGEECYGGEPNSDKRRWEKASATRLHFLELKNKEGEDVINMNTYKRCQKCIEFMHTAAATASLDPVTRADIAIRCVLICWKGLWPTVNPTDRGRVGERIQFKRKASFFAIVAAEAMSDVHGKIPNERAGALWIQASMMLSLTANNLVNKNYGWASLRAVALHALVTQGTQESSEEAATQLLMLVSTISPSNRKNGVMSSPSRRNNEDPNKIPTGSSRESYLESIADARSYLRQSAKVVAKDARARSKELFSQQNEISSLLVVQSKWVEDVPFKPSLIPMGVFSSDFSYRVLALRAVWSAIRFENCSTAQEQLLHQIYDLRKNSPASTLQTINTSINRQKLPIEITSIRIVKLESCFGLERVELKKKVEQNDHSMATFFNPYASKKEEKKTTTIPREEEQYISIAFTNKLSVPFEIASCKLKFDTHHSDRIKAPSISFVIPAQSKTFTVQFPFIILNKLNDDNVKEVYIDILEVRGLHITALSRSFFIPLGKGKQVDKCVKIKDQIIPKSASLYPRRDYSKSSKIVDQKSKVIDSPRLEIIPPQPNIRVSFVSSPTPIDDETIIPVLLADGEIFTLPNICVSNDTGLSGLGKIEKLQISATGLPGLSEVELYNISTTESKGKVLDKYVETNTSCPISISATCVGMDLDALNSADNKPASSFIAAKISAAPSMGSHSNECNVTLRFRYRGRSLSPTLEVWRKYEVGICILRVKGPRIPSLSFRCDLTWNSGYTELCNALAVQELRRRYKPARSYDFDLPRAGSTDNVEFVANRLGQDPGIHVCSDEVVVMISVANESASPINLSLEDGSSFGFTERMMSTLKVSPGVSAKFPIMLPRIDRSTDICERLTAMTRFKWKGDIPGAGVDDAKETGGPIFPVNRRVREGILEVPSVCLKNIVDENPIFLSRICKAPCSIDVNIVGETDGSESKRAEVGKPVDISTNVDMAEWLSIDLLERTNCTLNFCCARQDPSSRGGDNVESRNEFIWIGQIRKGLAYGKKSSQNPHLARLIFLNEGDYYVSACLSLSRVDNDGDVKEVWWAEKAVMIHVSNRMKIRQ